MGSAHHGIGGGPQRTTGRTPAVRAENDHIGIYHTGALHDCIVGCAAHDLAACRSSGTRGDAAQLFREFPCVCLIAGADINSVQCGSRELRQLHGGTGSIRRRFRQVRGEQDGS